MSTVESLAVTAVVLFVLFSVLYLGYRLGVSEAKPWRDDRGRFVSRRISERKW